MLLLSDFVLIIALEVGEVVPGGTILWMRKLIHRKGK